MSRALLDRVVDRRTLGDHDGRSGATLERLTLEDGTTLVLKHADPTLELGGLLGIPDAELVLWDAGAFARFPAGVGHAILDKWTEGGQILTLMRDLDGTVPGWSRQLTAVECERIFTAASVLHRAFVDQVPVGAVPLATRIGLLSPQTMASLDDPSGLAPNILRGWEHFHDQVDAEISDAVSAAHRDSAGLARAFASAPTTLLHADLWPVNLAIDADGVTFLDWAIATAGPAALECTVFLSGAADHVEASREEIIATFRRASGDLTDDRTMRVALFTSLCDLGWNKALDVAENEDSARARPCRRRPRVVGRSRTCSPHRSLTRFAETSGENQSWSQSMPKQKPTVPVTRNPDADALLVSDPLALLAGLLLGPEPVTTDRLDGF